MRTVIDDAGKATPKPSATPASRAAAGLVWGLWGVLFVAALGFVATFSRNVPFIDEWIFIPYLTGAEPVTVQWLWSQHNEHRIPLLKLTFVVLSRLSGCDFRAGVFLNVLLLGTLTFALLRVLNRIRGRTILWDAFFPLALLHFGFAYSLLWGLGVQYIASTFFCGLVLALLAARGDALSPGRSVLVGLCLVALPLCGVNGLVPMLPLALWFGWLGVRRWRSAAAHGRRDGGIILGFTLTALALVPLYLIGFEKPFWSQPDQATRTIRGTILSAARVLASGLGGEAQALWPLSGMLALGLAAVGVGVLLAAVRRHGFPERCRGLGLLAYTAAAGALVVAVGWGRSVTGGDVLWSYTLLAVPVWCGLYFIWEIYGPPTLRPWVQACLFLLAALLFPWNTRDGLAYGRHSRDEKVATERDLRDGLPVSLIDKRHTPYLLPLHAANQYVTNDLFASGAHLLKRAGVGAFRDLQDDPAFAEVALPVRPASWEAMTWEDNTGQGTGSESSVEFTLPAPRFVCGIRLRYSHHNERASPAVFRCQWRHPGAADDHPQPEWTTQKRWLETGSDRQVTIWVWDTVDRFRLRPDDKPFTFKVSEIVLLIPPPGPVKAGKE